MEKLTAAQIAKAFSGPNWACDFESDPKRIVYRLDITDDGEIVNDPFLAGDECFFASMPTDDFMGIYDIADYITVCDGDDIVSVLADSSFASFTEDNLRAAVADYPDLIRCLTYYTKHGRPAPDDDDNMRFCFSERDSDIVFTSDYTDGYTGIITGCKFDFFSRLAELEREPSPKFMQICEDLAAQANAWIAENC